MTIARNAARGPGVTASGPHVETKRRVERDRGVGANDPVIRHPARKGLPTNSIACGQDPARTGSHFTCKPCVALPLNLTATRAMGLTMHAIVARGEGRNIGRSAACSRGVPLAHNTAWDPGTARNGTSVVEPQGEIHRAVARDPGMKVDDPVIRHPAWKGLPIKGIACSQDPATMGSASSSSKPCAVPALNLTVTRGVGLPIGAAMAWGEGRHIGQTAAWSRHVPTVQAQTPTSGTIGTAAMQGTGHPLNNTATGHLGLPMGTPVI